jgi:hypothetical protein
MSTKRVTITLERQLLQEVRAVSGDNFSHFVSGLLRERLEALRRQQLEEALRAGYAAESETDLEIAREYQSIDREVAAREDE